MPTILPPDYVIRGPGAGQLTPRDGVRNPGYIYGPGYTPPGPPEPAPAQGPTGPAATAPEDKVPPESIPSTPPGTGIYAHVEPTTTPPTGGGGETGYGPLFDISHLPRGIGENQGTGISGSITSLLMGQNPFPEELVPPFSVRPGLNSQEIINSNPLLNPDNPGFMLAQAGQAQAQQAAAAQGQARLANVDLGQFQATTREVQPEELVSHQLNQLLASDSAYMENAALRGRELASQQGALSSSLFAGASQRAAVEAGLPIASQDAQAYVQAASQNMAAQNQMTLAKLDSATQQAINNSQVATRASLANAQMATDVSMQNAQLGTQASMQNAQLATQASIANTSESGAMNRARIAFEGQRLISDSRERIAEAQLNAQFTMQQYDHAQQYGMEQLAQQGRIDLSMLGGNIQAALQERGFTHDINLAELSQAQRIELEQLFAQPRWEAQMEFSRAQAFANIGMNAMQWYSNGIQNANFQDIDDAARARMMQHFNSGFERFMQLGDVFVDPENWSFDFSSFQGFGP